jgi:hypothetical protein
MNKIILKKSPEQNPGRNFFKKKEPGSSIFLPGYLPL